MTTIALTGGIASGKTTIAKRLAAKGAVIIDADAIAREIVAPGGAVLRRIGEAFGDRVIDDAGALDRAALSAIIFNDEAARERLNEITHPVIREISQQRVTQALDDDPETIIVHDIPLLVESRSNYDYDEIWVADAPTALRTRRLVEGRGLDPAEARARVEAQAPDEDRRRIADVLIDTSGTLDETYAQVDEHYAQLRPAAVVEPGNVSYDA